MKNTTKNNTISKMLIGLTLITLASVSFAKGPSQGGGYRMMQELNLNSQQQEQFKTVMKEQKDIAQKWRQSHHQATENKLSTFLSAEQMTQFKTMKEQRMQKRKMRKDNKMGRNNNY